MKILRFFLTVFVIAITGCSPKLSDEAARIKRNLEGLQEGVDLWKGALHAGDYVKAHKLVPFVERRAPQARFTFTPGERAIDFGNGEIVEIPPVGSKAKVPFAIFKKYEQVASETFWQPFEIEADPNDPQRPSRESVISVVKSLTEQTQGLVGNDQRQYPIVEFLDLRITRNLPQGDECVVFVDVTCRYKAEFSQTVYVEDSGFSGWIIQDRSQGIQHEGSQWNKIDPNYLAQQSKEEMITFNQLKLVFRRRGTNWQYFNTTL